MLEKGRLRTQTGLQRAKVRKNEIRRERDMGSMNITSNRDFDKGRSTSKKKKRYEHAIAFHFVHMSLARHAGGDASSTREDDGHTSSNAVAAHWWRGKRKRRAKVYTGVCTRL